MNACSRLTLFLFIILGFQTLSSAQSSAKSPAVPDSTRISRISLLKNVGVTDTLKTIIRVQVKESGTDEPIQGATVLIRRDQDKMLGRVTKSDGRCNFMPVPATYAVRVQLTGYQSFENPGLSFEKGKVYEVLIRMVRN